MRSTSRRKADVIARLEREANIWLPTASAEGVPHLVPLSLAWDGGRILVATPTDSPTVRNAAGSGRAKAALDDADDVVLIDGTIEVFAFSAVEAGAVEAGTIETYVRLLGWNPADQPGRWSMLVITPRTIRVWNGVSEIEGRTVMKQGAWLA